MSGARRLGIVVPYRDRQQHLDALLPLLADFFASPELRGALTVKLLVVEQATGLPFNRGMIKNIGYNLLAPEVDYICFHDVDLVPLDADYSWPSQPAMACFHGLDFKPDFVRQLFGGVVLLQKLHFEAANGYSNAYWNWGFEDVDLRERLLRCGLPPQHREGTYRKLPHNDEGSHPDGKPTEAHQQNQRKYTSQWFRKTETGWARKPNLVGAWRAEGLNSAQFDQLTPRCPIGPQGANAEHVIVALRHAPEAAG